MNAETFGESYNNIERSNEISLPVIYDMYMPLSKRARQLSASYFFVARAFGLNGARGSLSRFP